MSKYTLNDINFDPAPLSKFVPDPDYKADEEEIKRGYQKNRELMERLQRDFNERKMSGRRIV